MTNKSPGVDPRCSSLGFSIPSIFSYTTFSLDSHNFFPFHSNTIVIHQPSWIVTADFISPTTNYYYPLSRVSDTMEDGTNQTSHSTIPRSLSSPWLSKPALIMVENSIETS